MRFWWC